MGLGACCRQLRVWRTLAFLPLFCYLILGSHFPSLGLSFSICSKLSFGRLSWHTVGTYRYSGKRFWKVFGYQDCLFSHLIIIGHLWSGYHLGLGGFSNYFAISVGESGKNTIHRRAQC